MFVALYTDYTLSSYLDHHTLHTSCPLHRKTVANT